MKSIRSLFRKKISTEACFERIKNLQSVMELQADCIREQNRIVTEIINKLQKHEEMIDTLIDIVHDLNRPNASKNK